MAVLWLLAWPWAAPGQSAIDLNELGAPSFTTFSTRDGLPDSVIVSIQVDRQGFVWLGSQHGLARYDGSRWSQIEDPALDGYVDQIYRDHAGTLWAASRTFGLARHDGEDWHIEGAAAGLTSQHVRRVAETGTGTERARLWAVTWDQGLFYRARGRWHPDPDNRQLPETPLMALAETQRLGGQMRQWLGTGNQGLWYREGQGTWQPYHADRFAGSQIEAIHVSRDGDREALWFSVFGSGLWRLDESGLRQWSREQGELPSNELYNISETAVVGGGHAIWAASRAGLVRIYHDQARWFDQRHGLPANAVRNISQWQSPNGAQVLWLATEQGVARMIAGTAQWKTASLMGARQTGVFGVLVDHDARGAARLWVASAGDGLGLFTQGHWQRFSKASGDLPDSELRMIRPAADLDGKPGLWLSLRFGQLVRIHPGPRFENVATPWSHDSGQAVLDLLSRRIHGQTEQWFATRSQGIYRHTKAGWTAFRPAGVQGPWSVIRLLEQKTADGKRWLWATSNQGLARYDGRQWTLLGREIGLPGTRLIGLNLYPDAKGRPVLWLGSTHNGIIRVDASDPEHPVVLPDTLPPPPNANAYSAIRDSQGRIYICTNAGVQFLVPSDTGYRSRVFTRRDGVVHDECNTNAQFIDDQNRFWTGTLGGLAVYDPRSERPDHEAKPLMVTEVRIDGMPASRQSVVIGPGAHELRVGFALLSWQHEGESRFRTWLEGYEPKAERWRKSNFRDFGVLPPGDYNLHIEGRDYAGNISGPVNLPIRVQPLWWQHLWLRIALALSAVLGVYVLLRWRTLSLRQRQLALEGEIAVRTAELNDANRRLLELSYQDELTGLANRRRLLERLRAHRDTAATCTALIAVDVDHFKAYNDQYGHPAGDEALRCVAHDMQASIPDGALVARYGGEEFACLVPDCSLARALEIAERMRARVAACHVPLPGTGETRQVTISTGVARRTLRNEADTHALLREADQALYRAKAAGRNCVCS